MISTAREIVEDVPSPGQFDHVITVVPRKDGLVWLDSTAEVGPYQFLVSPLRDKHALVIWSGKPAALVSTPAELPYGTTQTFHMDAKLNDQGTLEGHADFTVRGDFEYLLRSGFRRVPLPQWKDLMQRISLAIGFGGEVSEVTASSPEKVDEPFHLAYKYTRKTFGDWANRRTLSALPMITLTAPSDDELLPEGPIWIGAPSDIQLRSEMLLPGGYRPQLPKSTHMKRDFAEYDATYDFKDGKLITERHLQILKSEVPASEREDYKQLAKAVQDDYGVSIALSSGTLSATVTGNQIPVSAISDFMNNLPGSSDPEALRLDAEAQTAIDKRDLQGAISALYRAVAADPKFVRDWVTLGGLLFTERQVDAGLDAFHKAIAADPNEPALVKILGISLMGISRFEDAFRFGRSMLRPIPMT